MTFRVEFSTDNDAFAADPDRECRAVLQRIRDRLSQGYVEGKCIDTNGNTIGKWELLANHG